MTSKEFIQKQIRLIKTILKDNENVFSQITKSLYEDDLKHYNQVLKELEVLEELKRSHIEYIEEEDRCYFVLKNTKRKEKSFTSKTFSDFWKGVFSNEK